MPRCTRPFAKLTPDGRRNNQSALFRERVDRGLTAWPVDVCGITSRGRRASPYGVERKNIAIARPAATFVAVVGGLTIGRTSRHLRGFATFKGAVVGRILLAFRAL